MFQIFGNLDISETSEETCVIDIHPPNGSTPKISVTWAGGAALTSGVKRSIFYKKETINEMINILKGKQKV